MAKRDGFYHYLPVDDSAMRWGIYVTGVGRGVIRAGEAYPPQGHPGLYHFEWQRGRTLPEFQLILISNGQGVFESEPTGEVPITPNSVVVLFPGVWHRYRPDPETGWTERWISFNGEIAHRLAEEGLVCSKGAVRPLAKPRAIEELFDHLIDSIHQQPTQNSILLSMHGMSLIASAIEGSADDLSSSNRRGITKSGGVSDPSVEGALDLIWTQSHRPLSVRQIAERLSVSRRTLERRFLAELGHSILEEINACRFSRAKRLLCETNLPVKNVAYLAGFASPERMRVSFLQREGLSPSDYRRKGLRRRKTRVERPERL